ncbi:cytochrome c [Paraburkholderia sp. CNPSo 3157]|uniref:Cytochrome c n=1 Tax=Paraburkholderia franconis TaxID=2654983 RepID=A0A7X1NB77_9BURK|nr:cytochrome c [Paraburkholderia franconis]
MGFRTRNEGLAWRNDGYLIAALRDFKTGARQNDRMSTVAKTLSDAHIAKLAAF